MHEAFKGNMLQGLMHLAAISIGATAAMGIAVVFRKKQANIWGMATTVLLIFLLVHPTTPALWAVAAGAICESSKYLPKKILAWNPLVALLPLAGIMMLLGDSLFVSWWAADIHFGLIPMSLLVLMLMRPLLLWKEHSYPVATSCIVGVTGGIMLCAGNIEWTMLMLTSGTLYVFATIMAVEPRGRPIAMKHGWWWGLGVGALWAVLLVAEVNYAELWALAFGNVASAALKLSSKT